MTNSAARWSRTTTRRNSHDSREKRLLRGKEGPQMKCVMDRQGEVSRVEDREAARLVATGLWVYVPKSVWKAEAKSEKAAAK